MHTHELTQLSTCSSRERLLNACEAVMKIGLLLQKRKRRCREVKESPAQDQQLEEAVTRPMLLCWLRTTHFFSCTQIKLSLLTLPGEALNHLVPLSMLTALFGHAGPSNPHPTLPAPSGSLPRSCLLQ